MLLLFLAIYLKSSFALLSSTENRISTRNLTCLHGFAPTTNILNNCEACLISYRNYFIETTLSLTGPGPAGISYACLKVNDVEAYHENLVRECRYFPRDTLNGYDDFCIASPYNYIRGSYRACICTTNACNFNYTRCIQQTKSFRALFNKTITELIDRVTCYQPPEKQKPQIYSNLTSLCSNDDTECKSYLLNHAVLCVINVDRTNQITRQGLIPSIYTAYIIKYKTQICNSFVSNPKSISFSQCQFDDTVCMCTFDGCNKDLETCRVNNRGICNDYYLISFLFVFVLNIFF